MKEQELMRLVLQASVAALVNVKTVGDVDVGLKRRAVKENCWRASLTALHPHSRRPSLTRYSATFSGDYANIDRLLDT